MPTLSAALIVKDEADHLPGCLESLRPLVDEICVVDTGSADDTVAIAEAAGCRIGQHAWAQDFAVARNASLALCTGNWVFVIDADERIDPDDVATLRGLLADPDKCYRMTTRNYSNDTHLSGFVHVAPGDPLAKGFAGWTPSTKVRLFPRIDVARFEGCVHELVNDSLAKAGIAVHTTEVPVHHYPYLRPDARVAAKRAMYLQLGRDKAAAAPDDPKAHAELGNQHLELGEVAAAIAAYGQAVRLAPDHAPYVKDLAGALFLANKDAAAEQAYLLALKLDETSDEVWRNLGVLYARAGRWTEALPCFEPATALAPDFSDGWRYLALAQIEVGADACVAAATALQKNPASTEAAALYASHLASLQRHAEARAFIDVLVAKHGTTQALMAAREQLGGD